LKQFGKISIWTGQFENNDKISNVNSVINAIMNEKKNTNKKRTNDEKDEIEAYAIGNKLIEPNEPENKIVGVVFEFVFINTHHVFINTHHVFINTYQVLYTQPL